MEPFTLVLVLFGFGVYQLGERDEDIGIILITLSILLFVLN
jgi:hypothetical protein